MTDIVYSRGNNKFDNLPEQRTASSFKEFGKAVLNDTNDSYRFKNSTSNKEKNQAKNEEMNHNPT